MKPQGCQTGRRNTQGLEKKPYSDNNADDIQYSIVILASAISALSPLAANIYIPVLSEVAKATGATFEVVSLSVTFFLYVCPLSKALESRPSMSRGRQVLIRLEKN